MNEHVQPEMGRRVAELRKLRGLTQAGLAARLHRSQSWVTKIERGERPLDSMTVLRELAAALSVPLRQLAELDPTPASDGPQPRSTDFADLRRALDLPVGASLERENAVSVADLQREALALRREYETARHNFSALAPTLPRLIRRTQSMVRAAATADQLRAHAVLVELYVLASKEFHRQGDLLRARVAIDRALMDAERSGDTLLIGVAGVATTAFLSLGDPTNGVATAGAFIDLMTRGSRAHTDAGTAVLGELHTVGALAAARAGERNEARRLMAGAERAARRLGRDAAPCGVYFGPMYLAVHETRLQVELGYPRQAARVGETIQLSKVPNVNRAGFHAAYLARAQSMRGEQEDALTTIAAGLRVAPEMFHGQAHPGTVARDIVRDMLRRRRRSSEQLRRIARDLHVDV